MVWVLVTMSFLAACLLLLGLAWVRGLTRLDKELHAASAARGAHPEV